MKVVYGGPNTILSIGVAEIDGSPMPFVGMVSNAAHTSGAFKGLEAPAAIDLIDKSGGVVIFFENPDAASRISFLMSSLFDKASETEWGEVEEIGGSVQ